MRGDSLGKVYSGNPQEEAACRVLSQKAALASSVLSSRTTLQGSRADAVLVAVSSVGDYACFHVKS